MTTNPTNITPLVTGVALTTASTKILGQNPTRGALMFHNRSQTLYIEIIPDPGVAGGLGSTLIQPGGYSPVFTKEIRATCGWQGHMVSGSGDITIYEWP